MSPRILPTRGRIVSATINGRPLEVANSDELRAGDTIRIAPGSPEPRIEVRPPARRQPSPELARRAAAFDRVIEALTAVAELSREDIALVRASLPDGSAQAATLAPLRAADLLRAISSADRELNAELEALDEPATQGLA